MVNNNESQYVGSCGEDHIDIHIKHNEILEELEPGKHMEMLQLPDEVIENLKAVKHIEITRLPKVRNSYFFTYPNEIVWNLKNVDMKCPLKMPKC